MDSYNETVRSAPKVQFWKSPKLFMYVSTKYLYEQETTFSFEFNGV